MQLLYMSHGNIIETSYTDQEHVWKNHGKSDKNTAELYNEMFGDNAWQKDILKYNSSLVDWGRSAERLTIVKSMSSQN